MRLQIPVLKLVAAINVNGRHHGFRLHCDRSARFWRFCFWRNSSRSRNFGGGPPEFESVSVQVRNGSDLQGQLEKDRTMLKQNVVKRRKPIRSDANTKENERSNRSQEPRVDRQTTRTRRSLVSKTGKCLAGIAILPLVVFLPAVATMWIAYWVDTAINSLTKNTKAPKEETSKNDKADAERQSWIHEMEDFDRF